MARAEVNDAEPPMAEADRPLDEVVRIVRTAVRDDIPHPSQDCRVAGGIAQEQSGNTAHR
jgi:hypothetical protein